MLERYAATVKGTALAEAPGCHNFCRFRILCGAIVFRDSIPRPFEGPSRALPHTLEGGSLLSTVACMCSR